MAGIGGGREEGEKKIRVTWREHCKTSGVIEQGDQSISP